MVPGAQAYQADAIVSLGGCDKTLPASLMPLARRDAIGITLYGGTISPGNLRGTDLTAGDTYEAIGRLGSGAIDEEEFKAIECCAIPGAGACGGMFTANTMSSVIEAMGMSIPHSASRPAVNADGSLNAAKVRVERRACPYPMCPLLRRACVCVCGWYSCPRAGARLC